MPVKPVQTLTGRIIRCILFDLGDTLWYRGEATIWERLENITNQQAVALLRERIDPRFLPMLDDLELGQRLRQAIDYYIHTRIRREPESEPDGALAVIETLHQWGILEIDRDFGAEIFEALRIRIPESRPLFDDSLSTIIELQQRGFLLGIVTNRIWGGPPFLEDLRTVGLYHYFHPDAIAISGDLGRRKPGGEIFLHALNALDVRSDEAVMVGDSLSADVLGAQALGIFAIWKPKLDVFKRIGRRVHIPTANETASLPAVRQSEQHDKLSLYRGVAGTAIDAQPAEPRARSTELTHDISGAINQAPTELPGMHPTDDDYILARDYNNDYLDRYLRGEITPDLIIERLSDLLEIFQKAGVQ